MIPSIYVSPGEAEQKLNTADILKRAVLVYGSCGFGKTTLIRHYLEDRVCLFTDVYEKNWTVGFRKSLAGRQDEPEVLVFDNLHFLKTQEEYDLIRGLILEKKYWIVMAGRCGQPGWLRPLYYGGELALISEKSLRLDRQNLKDLAALYGVTLPDYQTDYLCRQGEGNALFACIAIRAFIDHPELDRKEMDAHINRGFKRYVQCRIEEQWDPELYEFAMYLSLTEGFTLDLAREISGNDRAGALLERLSEIGSFMREDREGVYSFRHPAQNVLREAAERTLGGEKLKECRKRAADYYEARGRIHHAVSMYEELGDSKSAERLLLDGAALHADDAWLYRMRHHYLALPEERVRQEGAFLAARCRIHACMGDFEKSCSYLRLLEEKAGKEEGEKRQQALMLLSLAKISFSAGNDENLLRDAEKVLRELKEGGCPLPRISVADYVPDFAFGPLQITGRHRIESSFSGSGCMKELEEIFAPWAGGLREAVDAVFLYETGTDAFRVQECLARVQLQSQRDESLEIAFAAVFVQHRLAAFFSSREMADSILEGFRKRARRAGAADILENLSALDCHMALLRGDTEKVRKWMSGAPDEKEEFCSLHRFRYAVKIRCYTALHRYDEALYLIKLLQCYAESSGREYILIDCLLLEAVVRSRMGLEYDKILLDALGRAAGLGFIRIIGSEGAAILSLLKKIRKKARAAIPGEHEGWLDRVLEEAAAVAKRYPLYMGSGMPSRQDFSGAALRVLALQAEGRTIAEIASALNISERTVKYHSSETYRKLGVSGKTEAINRARDLKLI